MSTTITYKGNQIATASNSTVKLNTSAKWLEDDITIVDVSGGGAAISIVDEALSGGGTARHITGVDISNDTVTAGRLLAPYTAHDAEGNAVTGTIATRTSSDLTVSGATVTAAAGYYASSVSKSVASGTAGTPTATKGSVSNHAVTVTPSVTNTTGYITGGTKTGTAVTVSASELVSGTKSITENGTGIDVTNYASVDVDVPSGASAFVVTLNLDAQDNWVPDCTFAEAYAAWDAGKLIVFSNGSGDYSVPDNCFYYTVHASSTLGVVVKNYIWDSNGSVLDNSYTFYDTYDATAVPADVASGKTFYNGNGLQTGTNSGGGGGSGVYDWIAAGAEHVTKLVDLTLDFNDTGFTAWTPSTTSSTILAAQSNYATYSADRTAYEYYIMQRIITDVKYNSNNPRSATTNFIRLVLGAATVNPYDLTELENKSTFTSSSTTGQAILNLYFIHYFDTNGIEAGRPSLSYGPACSSPGWGSVSGTPNNTTFTLSRPAITAQCHNTYFSTSSAADVDTDLSTWRWIVDIFRAPKPRLCYGGWYAISDILNGTIQEY